MAKRSTKTSAAAKAAFERAQAFEAVGLSPASSFLVANANVAVQRNTQSTVQSARREDAFDALKAKMQPGAYDAARRLEKDLRTRRGEDDRGPPPIRVNGRGELAREDRMILAGERVDAVMRLLGARDAILLTELIVPSREWASWRDIVESITGESNMMAQAAVVRSACANLLFGYNTMDSMSQVIRPQAIAL